MPDRSDELTGVRRMPIFPLPLILLPGEMLPLHIFEDRYRAMLDDVRSGDDLFGVTFFEPHEEFLDRPLTGSIGCIAKVRDVEDLADGRSNIVVLGQSRYRLLDYMDGVEPYLVGEVELFQDDDDGSEELKELAEIVYDLFVRVAKAAFKMGGNRGQLPDLEKTEPEALSFLIAAGFNFDSEMKLHLVESTSSRDRLEKLREILVKTVDQIEDSADIQAVSRTNGHSKKKLDL